MSKFTLEGAVKPKTTIYNKQLATKIAQILNPGSGKPRTEDNSLLTRFEKFAHDAHRDGVPQQTLSKNSC